MASLSQPAAQVAPYTETPKRRLPRLPTVIKKNYTGLRLPSPKIRKPVKPVDLTTYSTYFAGDVTMRSDFDPAAAERVELAALRKLSQKTQLIDDQTTSAERMTTSPEDQADAEEIEDDTLVFNLRKCTYPLICCKVRADMGAPLLYLVHIGLAAALFASAAYFAEVVPWYQWAGVPYWCYAVFFGVCLMAPLFSDLLVELVLLGIRAAIAREEHRLNKELKRAMELLFFLERMRADSSRLIFFTLDTVAFVVLFTKHPDYEQWDNAFQYTSGVLGALCVWALGQVVTSYVTNSISRSVNVQTLGNKIRDVLFSELAIYRLTGASPPSGDERLYHLAQQKHLYEDPRTAAQLASTIMRSHMAADLPPSPEEKLKGRRTRVALLSDTDGRLLGAYLFGSILQLAQKREAQTQRIMAAIGHTTFVPKQYDYLDLHFRFYTKRELVQKMEQLDSLSNPKRGMVMHFTRRYMYKRDVEVMLANRALELPRLPKIDTNTAWKFFDSDQIGRVSLRRVRAAVNDHVSTRINLRGTLKNAHSVVKKLRVVVSVVVNFFVFLCALAIFQVNVLNVWVGISSIILGFSFVFGATLKSILDSLVFIFAMHTFDVGDKIKVGTNEQTYYVREISLMSTKMARWDGSITKMQNYLLLNMQIINCRESESNQQTVTFMVDAQTIPSKADLDDIQSELEVYLASDRAAFTGGCAITIRDIQPPLQAQLVLWWSFAYNNVDEGRLYRDKTRVIMFMVNALRRKRIKATTMGAVDLDKNSRSQVRVI